MSRAAADDKKLKEALKIALREVLDERKEMLRDILEEALEDVALSRAIEEGRRSGDSTRSEILSALEGRR